MQINSRVLRLMIKKKRLCSTNLTTEANSLLRLKVPCEYRGIATPKYATSLKLYYSLHYIWAYKNLIKRLSLSVHYSGYSSFT